MHKIGKLAFICLFFFLLTTLVIAFHHHHDGCSHDDCPLCMAVAHYNVSPINLIKFSFDVYLVFIALEISKKLLQYDYISYNFPFSRAPPV